MTDTLFAGQEKQKLLLSFSVCANGKKLLNTAASGDTLTAVHGIRFITICWVVLGHRYTVDVGVPSINLLIFPDVSKRNRIGPEKECARVSCQHARHLFHT
jgi:hypothetical protein